MTLPQSFPLSDETITKILMHRDAHFGGLFSIMLDYYSTNEKVVDPEISFKDIQTLAKAEQAAKENLAPLLLSGPQAERVGRSKDRYKALRALFEEEKPHTHYARLIAALILSDEENPEKEIAAIVKEGSAIVPALITMIKEEELYDPLFPGYGQSPYHALSCLEQIGDKRSIATLFEFIGRNAVIDEEGAIAALHHIGDDARDFLLSVVKGKPITEDNERAAIALIHFKEDPLVAKSCLDLLHNETFRQTLPLAVFLTLACEGLNENSDKEKFTALLEDKATPEMLKPDIRAISSSWKKH